MASAASWPGGKSLISRLEKMGKITFEDVRPLLEEFERILLKANKRTVLAGKQTSGQDMPPVQERKGIYKGKTGPPLAPSGLGSRVITLVDTAIGQMPGGKSFYATKVWDAIKSREGVPFMHYHFEGAGHNPVRDLRGIDEQGLQEALAATRIWAQKVFTFRKIAGL